jgi:D-sedoheptulose 7-phosphate isomerase
MNREIISMTSPSMFLKNYLKELSETLDIIDLKQFDEFINELILSYEKSSFVFICGNGGSAATAAHFACDINKGVSFGREKRFKVICLNDNLPIVLAYANDTSYDRVFVEQLSNFMNKDDLIIGISGSGNSENILKAIKYGNEKGGRTFGICGYGGGKLKNIAQKSLVINSNDMQKVEDAHLILFHCAMQYLYRNTKDG